MPERMTGAVRIASVRDRLASAGHPGEPRQLLFVADSHASSLGGVHEALLATASLAQGAAATGSNARTAPAAASCSAREDLSSLADWR
jgi:hypothetical protein